MTEPVLRPVFDADRRCIGTLLHTARGVRAFDQDDHELGTYPDETEASDVLFKAAGFGEREAG